MKSGTGVHLRQEKNQLKNILFVRDSGMTKNETNKLEYDLSSISGYVDNKLEWPDVPPKKLNEGQTEFQVADATSIYDAPAFFNPIMVLNRDMSILFSRIYKSRVDHPIRVIEPLAGIGIRALRLVSELGESISEIVINDFDQTTTHIASYNRHQLGFENKVIQFKREAKSLLLDLAEKNFKYHYLDLDPFGPPVQFLDSIWGVLSLSAIVSVTATDMTALCGIYPDACLRKYGSIPLNNFHTHETASRILINSVVMSAGRHGVGLTPIFTLSADHYVKVFFETRKGRGEANKAAKQLGFSYTCKNCMQIFYIAGFNQPSPKCCGELSRAGPLWVGDLFSKVWSEKGYELVSKNLDSETSNLLPSAKRLLKILTEGFNGFNLPGYYAIDEISSKLRIKQPKFLVFKEAMEERGYKAILTQFRKQSFRTDASIEIINEVFKTISERERNQID
jgi:tRNA (guanine26-N2/guanine27-N2)-dimethyltransferase